MSSTDVGSPVLLRPAVCVCVCVCVCSSGEQQAVGDGGSGVSEDHAEERPHHYHTVSALPAQVNVTITYSHRPLQDTDFK